MEHRRANFKGKTQFSAQEVSQDQEKTAFVSMPLSSAGGDDEAMTVLAGFTMLTSSCSSVDDVRSSKSKLGSRR